MIEETVRKNILAVIAYGKKTRELFNKVSEERNSEILVLKKRVENLEKQIIGLQTKVFKGGS